MGLIVKLCFKTFLAFCTSQRQDTCGSYSLERLERSDEHINERTLYSERHIRSLYIGYSVYVRIRPIIRTPMCCEYEG